jgi:hypothetical protein
VEEEPSGHDSDVSAGQRKMSLASPLHSNLAQKE